MISWVPMESIKEREPYVLIAYYELVIKLFGSNDPEIYYPLYFTRSNEEKEDEEYEEKQKADDYKIDYAINDDGEEGVLSNYMDESKGEYD